MLLFLIQRRRFAVAATATGAVKAIGAADCAVTGPLLSQRICAPGAGGILPPGLLCAAVADPAKRVLAHCALAAIVTAIVLLSQCILPVGTIAREGTTA